MAPFACPQTLANPHAHPESPFVRHQRASVGVESKSLCVATTDDAPALNRAADTSTPTPTTTLGPKGATWTGTEIVRGIEFPVFDFTTEDSSREADMRKRRTLDNKKATR